MERRKEPRVAIDQQVMVTLLGETDLPPFQASTLDMSGGGMRLLSPVRVPYQAAVKVQAGELLLLAEVIRVEEYGQGYSLALKLEHSLFLLNDLYRLNEAIRREEAKVDELTIRK
jgi:hypothetical protein